MDVRIEKIRKEIKLLSGNNAEFYDKLNPTAKPSAGVRIPALRKLARQIAKEDYKGFLRANPMDTFELELLQGMVIGYAKGDIHDILQELRQFIPRIHDWAVNDIMCSTFKIAKKYPQETFEVLGEFFDSEREFEVRASAVMLMSYFLTEEYIDRVLEVLDHLQAKEYYAKMGIAWALAEALAKFPDKTFRYMTDPKNHLDDWIFRKALQKMRESSKVDNELAEKIKKEKTNGEP